MIRKITEIGIALLLIVASGAVCARNIDLFVGEVNILDKVEVDRVAIGKDGIVKVEILSTQELLIIGEQVGSTSLRLWNKDGSQYQYNIRVAEQDPEKRVRMDSMIRISVKMVEFRKSALSKLGIDWSKDINGPTFATVGDFVTNSMFRSPNAAIDGTALPLNVKPFSSYFGITTALTSRINLLASDGDAVVLSEPVLSCINGGTAKFISGGEYPIPVIGNNGGTSVEFKQYGIKMEISPRANREKQIYTTIKAEVSEIDQSTTVLGVPGILKNETETIVNVNSGQTIVISGLLKAKQGRGSSKVPGLGDLPLVGRLFSTDDVQNEMSEMVVFLTPEVVEAEDTYDEHAERLMGISHRTIDQLKERLKFSILD
ncbi:MAG: pilus assembly protein N-terminal domain-containing protein [Candidatus Thiodiazotropha sp. (ex Lucinoma borealis)]|nr:pilus assembly protein N-terminal domain-containing protein [Candidatus Thiodiazotropha sp. (ex Lucinoma borealis)]MCU7855889.1 pilus assembly protein N-terminal domain-containing protein [Candidatus Thiodiazotropha sp. (ex Lucinoma borealis)]